MEPNTISFQGDFRWYYEWDGQVLCFPDHYQQAIELHFLGKEQHQVKVNGECFSLHFPAFKGVSNSSKEIYLIRTTGQRSPYPLPLPHTSSWEVFNLRSHPSALPLAQAIYYLFLNNHWIEMDSSYCQDLEESYQRFRAGGDSLCMNSHKTHMIDFNKAIQYRPDNPNNFQSIFRVELGWYWETDLSGTFKGYLPGDCKMIEKAYNEHFIFVHINVDVEGVENHYVLDLNMMKQNRCGAKFRVRNICRVGPPVERTVLRVKDSSQVLVKATSYPKYWDLNNEQWKSKKIALVEVPLGSEEGLRLCGMIESTTNKRHKTRYGLVPGTKKVPVNYRVLKIERVQNDALWIRLIQGRTKILERTYFGDPKHTTTQLADHLHNFPIKTIPLDETNESKTNEFYFFHGTKKKTLMKIVKVGFDDRQVSELVTGEKSPSMFGTGVYFAESISKSNQYITCPRCNRKSIQTNKKSECKCHPSQIKEAGGYVVIIARVILGDAHICTKYDEGKYKHKEAPPKKAYSSQHYDSILAEARTACPETKLKMREVVVYDMSQLYPEYLVYYEREGSEDTLPEFSTDDEEVQNLDDESSDSSRDSEKGNSKDNPLRGGSSSEE
eukprot:TRINITY_DN11193_c0_g1_i2.p1 TRINITY_DN11193_c0_g1~~TRINITY_DN11193_c0_g1_i2.p1  ORF type:complete len:610 (+),score=165.10 TRINITY_DN11193_c0_g1_i2:37-1866(+)